MKHDDFLFGDIVAHEKCEVKSKKLDIRVSVRLPKDVPNNIRQRKINKIYDLLVADVHE